MASPVAEVRLREILARLDDLMATRRAVEFARSERIAAMDRDRRAWTLSETSEEFDALARDHARTLAGVGRLDAELARLDALRARALRAASNAAAKAAADADGDRRANLSSLAAA